MLILGEYGPLILVFITFLLGLDYVYIIGLFLSSLLNMILKKIIRQPRPQHKSSYFAGFGNEKYGMPSGHAQMSFYTTIYVYLKLRNINIFCFYLLYSLFICYQRVVEKYHTRFQVIVGALVGSLFGYFIYTFGKYKHYI